MLNKSSIGVAAALVAACVWPAQAQETQRIEITGSSIKRTDAEGPVPVEIYTRKDIARSGATTVHELVKSIAAFDIDDQGELTANSPTGSGASQLQVRGLSERNVLVLLNGRRLPINALTDGSGAGAAVDVNNIPISAIERVEILKDGGSAIYGSDAVAGVINFITRKNYTGVEARAGFGVSSRSDGEEKAGGIVAGFGDFDKSGFNVLAAIDVFKRDPIGKADRDISRSADWRRFDGVTDGRSGFHPNGNILNAAGTAVVGQLVPCPPEDLRGTTCRFDFNKTVLTLNNGADRFSTMVIGNLKLGGMRAFAELLYSESKDRFQSQAAPGAFQLGGNTVNGRFMQVGPRTTDRDSSLLSTTLGLEGSVAAIDWDVAVGQGISKVENQDSNYLDNTLFNAAIANGTIDPTSNSNPTAAVDAIRLTPNRKGRSVVKFVNARATGSLMELAGGSLGYALGVQFNKETLRDTPDANQQAGNVFGSIAQAAVDAKRDLKAVFGELAIPLTKNLEGQIAVRHDQYSGASGTIGGVQVGGAKASRTSPKVALKYRPVSVFALRASYAESFLAPSLKQMFGGQDEGAESTSDTEILCPAFGVTDPTQCDNFPYRNVTGSNPNLKPETGKTFNIGFVVEPAPAVSLAMDFWKIRKENEVNQPTVESAVQQGLFNRRVSGEWQVFTNNLNIASTQTSGVDIDIRARLADTPWGKLSLRDSATYYHSVKTRTDAADPLLEYVGTFLQPRWRNTLTLNLESAAWATTLALRTTSGMRDTEQDAGSTAYARARDIGAHEELDLGLQYTGIQNLTLSGSIKNLLDNSVPYSQRGTLNQNGSLGFPWLYNPRGRFFQASVGYAFR